MNKNTDSDYDKLGKELLRAVSDKDVNTVKQLIKEGVDVNYKNKYGHFALFVPTNIEIVKLLLENGADPNLQNDTGKTTMMRLTSYAGDDADAILDLLIKFGANVNMRDMYGKTALLEAVYNANPTIVKSLLDKGADPNLGWPLATGAGVTPLIVAAQNDQFPEIAIMLLKAGANISHKDKLGADALYKAVRFNNIEIVKQLLYAGANLNVDYNGKSIFDIASPPMRDFLSTVASIKFRRGVKAAKQYIAGDKISDKANPKNLNKLREKMCKDLNATNNLQELQGMASVLEIDYKGKDKATLCADLAVDYVVKAKTGTQLPYIRARFPSSTDERTITKSVKDLRTLPARDLRLLKKWYVTNDIRELASKILANSGVKNVRAKLPTGVNPNMSGFTEAQIKERLGVETLQGADLSNANLQQTHLVHANLSNADLSGADLTGADLRGANLFRATLSDAIFDNAQLNNAMLVNAKLEYTHFTGADLTGADFTGTDIRGAWFDDAIVDDVIGLDLETESESESESESGSEPELELVHQTAQEREARERARQLFAARQAQAVVQAPAPTMQLAANRADCTNTHEPTTLDHVNDIPDADLIKINVLNETSDRIVRVDCLDKHGLADLIENSRVYLIVNGGAQVVYLTIGEIRYYIIKDGLQGLLTANLDGKRVLLEPIGRRNIVKEHGTIVTNEMIHQIDIIDIAAYNEMYEFAIDMLGLRSGAAMRWAREVVKREGR